MRISSSSRSVASSSGARQLAACRRTSRRHLVIEPACSIERRAIVRGPARSRHSSASGLSRAPSQAVHGVYARYCDSSTRTCILYALVSSHSKKRLTPYQTFLLPLAFAFDHPVALRVVELAPRRVERDAALLRVLLQVVLAFLDDWRLPRLDRAAAQRLALVGNHQAEVDADDAAEAAAGLAGAERRVEREQLRHRLAIATDRSRRSAGRSSSASTRALAADRSSTT